MTFKKNFLFFLLIVAGFHVVAQTTDSTIFLKWKLKPDEVIAYRTIMKEIDLTHRKDVSLDGAGSLLGIKDKIKSDTSFDKLSRQLDNSDLISHLTEKKKGIIDISMSIAGSKGDDTEKNKITDSKEINERALLNKMMSGIMLRGAIYEDGTIASFYTARSQQNLIDLFFALPGKAVKVGDSWSLNTNTISMDQNFICDSSYRKNTVTLVGLEKSNDDRIAVIKYDIVEYVSGNFNSPFNNASVPTMMLVTYEATAKFSIKQGRWIYYNGKMSTSSTGFMSAHISKEFALVAE